ncbi:uncharacterized protein LOC116846936 isoform X3 [Odontomachus brunneus]|nr:uncharacterized protein LOC116846936 isoform X3 [Odontomachus brunneus]XP_032677252.1 uncharacterized protein LOC116846936 isoform X3 [Odontomachus brunneus]
MPLQPTRAFCKYCKKDLHAHRLSLLKHTCTMKHQRAALLINPDKKTTENLPTEQAEDNDDDSEYVVERLDLDEDDTIQEKLDVEPSEVTIDEIEQKESSDNLCLQLQLSDEEEHKPVIKKIELSEEKDALAEAMAHVHGEYLEMEEEDENNVELEMVVEEEALNPEIEVILPDVITDEIKEKSKEFETGKTPRHMELKAVDKKSAKKLLTNNKGDVIVASLPVLETTYQLNNSISSTQDGNIIPATSTPNRTITLTSGGKTLTLTGGTFQPGTQYVLSKIKGSKLPTLMMADNKKPIVAINQSDTSKTVQLTTMLESATTPSTSQQSSKKSSSLKTKIIPKRLHISTHVVDITKGLPVSGLQVSLYKLLDGRWTFMNESNTNANGRCIDLLEHSAKSGNMAGRYKIHFDVDKYFTLRRIETMYPFIEIVFDVKNPLGHYHIPILLSPFGYSTYRGS